MRRVYYSNQTTRKQYIMSATKSVEEFVNSYSNFGYEVDRVSARAVMVSLPQSGQNFDDFIVELRAMGCSVNFDVVTDVSPPKVELSIHPGVHPSLLDDCDEHNSMFGRSRRSDLDEPEPSTFYSSKPQRTCPVAAWICVASAALIVFFFLLLAWKKTTSYEFHSIHNGSGQEL